MLGNITQFFTYMWSSITAFFGDIGNLLFNKNKTGGDDALVSPPMSDGRFSPSDAITGEAALKSAEAKKTVPAFAPITLTEADKKRIRISAYGADDIQKWQDYRQAHNMDISDAQQQLAHDKADELKRIWTRSASPDTDSAVLYSNNKQDALAALSKYNAKAGELNELSAANPLRTPKNLEEFFRISKGAKLAEQNTTGLAPQVTLDGDRVLVTLPKGIREAEINVSRINNSSALSVDIIPKGGEAKRIDNLTLAELNSMIVTHPGEGTHLSVNTKDDVKGVNIAVVTADKGGVKLVDALDKSLVHMGEHVGVNGVYQLAQGKTAVVTASFVPPPTPAVTKPEQKGV